MYKTNILLLAVAAVPLIFLSCSTSRPDSGTGMNAHPIFPGWYSASPELISNASGFSAYGTALAADSAAATDKAVAQALSTLERHLSERLESIRSRAAEAAGEESGLNSPDFIFELRTAEAGISTLTATSHKVAHSSRQDEGYRGFAGVNLSRARLVEYLDEKLADDSSWEAMKKTDAFQQL